MEPHTGSRQRDHPGQDRWEGKEPGRAEKRGQAGGNRARRSTAGRPPQVLLDQVRRLVHRHTFPVSVMSFGLPCLICVL